MLMPRLLKMRAPVIGLGLLLLVLVSHGLPHASHAAALVWKISSSCCRNVLNNLPLHNQQQCCIEPSNPYIICDNAAVKQSQQCNWSNQPLRCAPTLTCTALYCPLYCPYLLQGNSIAETAAQAESAAAKRDPFTAPRKARSGREDNYEEVLSLAYLFYEGQMAGDLPA